MHRRYVASRKKVVNQSGVASLAVSPLTAALAAGDPLPSARPSLDEKYPSAGVAPKLNPKPDHESKSSRPPSFIAASSAAWSDPLLLATAATRRYSSLAGAIAAATVASATAPSVDTKELDRTPKKETHKMQFELPDGVLYVGRPKKGSPNVAALNVIIKTNGVPASLVAFYCETDERYLCVESFLRTRVQDCRAVEFPSVRSVDDWPEYAYRGELERVVAKARMLPKYSMIHDGRAASEKEEWEPDRRQLGEALFALSLVREKTKHVKMKRGQAFSIPRKMVEYRARYVEIAKQLLNVYQTETERQPSSVPMLSFPSPCTADDLVRHRHLAMFVSKFDAAGIRAEILTQLKTMPGRGSCYILTQDRKAAVRFELGLFGALQNVMCLDGCGRRASTACKKCPFVHQKCDTCEHTCKDRKSEDPDVLTYILNEFALSLKPDIRQVTPDLEISNAVHTQAAAIEQRGLSECVLLSDQLRSKFAAEYAKFRVQLGGHVSTTTVAAPAVPANTAATNSESLKALTAMLD
jgi:hypothetical protein